MTIIWIVLVIILLVVAYSWGVGSGRILESMEHDDTKSFYQTGLHKIDKLNNYRSMLKNVGGGDDIDAAFNMALRLISCGLDPKDILKIDRIGMAIAEGKFEFVESTDEAVQEALDKINEAEGKK